MSRVNKRQLVREVDDLFDTEAIFERAAVQLCPDLVDYYARVSPYGFAIERQSEGKRTIGDPNKTGHECRVSAILRLAGDLYLPAPEERSGRMQGEARYVFDERHWFIDGERNRATGWSARPEVRPRLWMAYALARRLKELRPEAAPAAFVVGDPTRLFREDQWLRVWARAILQEQILLYVDGFDGPVTEHEL
jgi:hypothetical protein